MTSVHMFVKEAKVRATIESALLVISPKINQSPFLLKRQ